MGSLVAAWDIPAVIDLGNLAAAWGNLVAVGWGNLVAASWGNLVAALGSLATAWDIQEDIARAVLVLLGSLVEVGLDTKAMEAVIYLAQLQFQTSIQE